MKCTVVYATLSGSTMSAANVVTEALKAGTHEVEYVSADSMPKDQVKNAQAVVFASPSWEDEGKDGQPLPDMTHFIKSLTAEDLAGKKVAICGLGDTSYVHFCGAVDVMEGLLKGLNATPIVPSLRVDRYYSVPDNEKKVRDWAEGLAKSLV